MKPVRYLLYGIMLAAVGSGGCTVEGAAGCGDGTCEALENCANCPGDCTCADNEECSAVGLCVCLPSCHERACDQDGCGGECGPGGQINGIPAVAQDGSVYVGNSCGLSAQTALFTSG